MQVEAAVVAVKEETAAAPVKAPRVSRTKKAEGEKKAPAKKAEGAAKSIASKTPKKAKPVIAYQIIDRPNSGARLYAFTEAVLRLSGLAKGKSIPKRELRQVMGETALRYHLATKFTLEESDTGAIALSATGKDFFKARAGKIDEALVTSYMSVLSTGKPDEATTKNPNFIKAVA